MDILILSDNISKRLKYVCKFIFNEFLSLNCNITSNVEQFNAFRGIKINYTKNYILQSINIFPKGLIFSNGINYSEPPVLSDNEVVVLYPCDIENYYRFDIFSAVFFMISRIEEYDNSKKDKLGRFNFFSSFSVKNNFFDIPIVDIWIYDLKSEIEKKFNTKIFDNRKFTHTPTIDIDNAFAYKYKGLIRNLGGYCKSIIKFDFTNILKRSKVLLGLIKDPYDTFEYIETVNNKYDISPIYFFLVGKYGKYDKNISLLDSNFNKIISNISEKHEVALHPSFGSNSNPEKLKYEKETLSKYIKNPVIKSRQHFLMIKFPETYERLIENQIFLDYSMGFAHAPSFRAGTSTPFYFFNIIKEEETSLKLFPFQIMDTTLTNYLKTNTIEASVKISDMIKKVKNVKGNFVSLWHNETFSRNQAGDNWREVYEKMHSVIFERDENKTLNK